jgi:MFS family permease
MKIDKTWIIIVACSFNIAIFSVVQMGTSIALPTIQKDLGLTNEIQQWVINSFTLGSACAFIIFGKVAKIITTKTIYLFGVFFMMLASIGCAFSFNGSTLLFFRFLQGMSIAMTAPAAISLVRESITDGKYDKYFSWFITINTFYFIIGPLLFGYIIEYLSWRLNYILAASLCIIAMLSIFFIIPSKKMQLIKFDYLGSIFLFSGTFILITTIMNIGFNGWNDLNKLLMIVFILITICFIWHSLKCKYSVFPLSLLKNLNVITCSIIGFTLQGCLMVVVFIGLLLLEYFKLSPVQVGYFIMFSTIFGMISTPIFGKFTHIGNRKRMIMIEMSLIIAAFIGLGLSALFESIIGIFIFTAIFKFFTGPLLSALPSQISSSVDADIMQEVNSVVFHFRYLGASICIAIMGAIAYGDSANTEDSMTNTEFSHVMIFMSLLVFVSILLIKGLTKKLSQKI